MIGHGEKLSRKKEAAIAALLSTPTIGDAADMVGIGEATLNRWLRHDGFKAAYREARRQVLQNAIGKLQEGCDEAVEALRRNLVCGVPTVEVAAARIMLDQAARGLELFDLADRLYALETHEAAHG